MSISDDDINEQTAGYNVRLLTDILQEIECGCRQFSKTKITGRSNKGDELEKIDATVVFDNVKFEKTSLPIFFTCAHFVDCRFSGAAVYARKEGRIRNEVRFVGCNADATRLFIEANGSIENSRFEECWFEGEYNPKIADARFFSCDFIKCRSLELPTARLFACALPVARSQIIWSIERLLGKSTASTWPQLRVTYTPLKLFIVLFASLFFVLSETSAALTGFEQPVDAAECLWAQQQDVPATCRFYQLFVGYNQHNVLFAFGTILLSIYNILRMYITLATIRADRVLSTSTRVPDIVTLDRLANGHVIVTLLGIPALAKLLHSAWTFLMLPLPV